MRLIDVDTFELREFLEDSIPPYAILSHRWEEEEVLFQDMQNIELAKKKRGFEKIHGCCEQAKAEGWSWVWVDTCCIDKTSSAELSEAINSMFRWYQSAMVCFAYLSDVASSDSEEYEYDQSQWFKRGWTLQELLAPHKVSFYSRSWICIGEKSSMSRYISKITGISRDVLENRQEISTVPVAIRMYWASERKTTRIEDMAYALLGIFDVNMPLLYGEGTKAFQRLQEYIWKETNDHTLLLWDNFGESSHAKLWKPYQEVLLQILSTLDCKSLFFVQVESAMKSRIMNRPFTLASYLRY
ncbi:HET-domain-containing protein [Xylariaceae sp. FL0016]|nr:HET-domain-containing protein [Xylariaceae sp. FL0016]